MDAYSKEFAAALTLFNFCEDNKAFKSGDLDCEGHCPFWTYEDVIMSMDGRTSEIGMCALCRFPMDYNEADWNEDVKQP